MPIHSANISRKNQIELRSSLHAYSLTAGLVLSAAAVALIHGHGFLVGQKIGLMCRVMMTSVIYKKV